MNVLVITFNCAKELQTQDAVSRLLDAAVGSAADRPEIIAFCLQELAPITDACLRYSDAYLNPFIDAVPNEFEMLAESVCGSTGLVVFRRRDSREPTHVETQQTSFGMLWSSLKGAALVSISYGASEALTIVSAHLAAGENAVAQRNRDLALLYDALSLEQRFGQLILGGDLNYRTTSGTLDTDQLTAELANNVAPRLTEGPIAFEPTYKFFPGTSTYNSKRTKSFCDRVLFSEPAKAIEYTAIDAGLTSDHHPVALLLSTNLHGEPTNTSIISSGKNREIVSYVADLVIGSAMFTVSTSTGRKALVFGVAFLAIYIFIIAAGR